MALTIHLSGGNFAAADADVLALGVVEAPLEKQPALVELDGAFGGLLLEHAGKAEFRGKRDQTFCLPSFGRIAAGRVALIGLGPKRGVDQAAIRTYCALAAKAGNAHRATRLALLLPERAAGPAVRAVGEGVVLGAYRFTKYLTGDRAPKAELADVTAYKAGGRPTASERRHLDVGARVARGVCTARDAVNEPANVMNPEALAALAKRIARKGKLRCKVLDKAGIAEAGMKLHGAVGQGSANEPRFIHLTYRPKRTRAKLAFVGKGLTFDSGGLCIKPAPGMGEMKSDMGGAAAVLGLMACVGEVRPDVEVHGIIGAAENMPDAGAYRPGDVFGSLDGKTVEIVNTDAEGRLVLADALAYAKNLEPDAIVDAATLTGACVVALGKTCAAYYTASAPLARQFEHAHKESGEAFWRMPLLEDLRDQMKSDIADLKHVGDRWGGSISAALFLREFVGDVPWIHCDIAGPALADRGRGVYAKGGTGHAALTFLRFVENAGAERTERRRGERRRG